MDLYDYILNMDEDPLIENPYLGDLKVIVKGAESRRAGVDILREKRNSLVEKYCFSIPFTSVLNIVKDYAPITELGAGTGYYAYCLRQMGVDIEAYDLYSPDDEDPLDFMGQNHWFDDTWTMVLSGDEDIVRSCRERSLFMCWPPPESKMAFNALEIFKKTGGDILIYIGDPISSADDGFFKALEKEKLILNRKIPSWQGINERLMIYSLRKNNAA